MEPKRQAHGFTLVELVIVMAIIAILAVIAVPSYQSFVLRGRQADAQEFMLAVTNAANHYRLSNRNYPQGLAGGAGELDMTVPAEMARFYDLTVTADNAAAPPQFTVTATPKTGTAQASAATLEITSDGKKTPAEVWK